MNIKQTAVKLGDNDMIVSPTLQLNTRSKILQAAIELFSKSGYAGTSLRDITGLAGVNHGSIKYHYTNKEELWRSVVNYLYGQLDDWFNVPDEEWESMLPRQRVEFGIRTYIRFIAKNPALFKITMFETMHNSPQCSWLMENITIRYTNESLAFIKKAKKEGIYSQHISDMNLFYLLIGATRNIFFVAPEISQMFGKDMFSEVEIKRHEDATVELFLGHLPRINDET